VAGNRAGILSNTPLARGSVLIRGLLAWLSVAALTALPQDLSAATLPLDAPSWAVTSQAEYWLDPSGAADFAAARDAPFQPIVNSNFGKLRGALWLRVAIDNPGPPAARVLRVGPAMLEYVDLWLAGNGGVRHEASGLAVPMAVRPLPGRVSLFPVTLPSGKGTLYLRLASPSRIIPDVSIWQAPALAHDARISDIRSALMFGALLMIALMALVYALWMREWIWGCYALGMLSVILFESSYEGFAAAWLWPGQPTLSLIALPVGMALGQGSLTMFVLGFIPMARLHRSWRLLWSLPLATALALAVVFAAGYRYGEPMVEWIGLANLLALPLLLFAAWRRGFGPARFALASFGLIYFVIALQFGRLFGWWPNFGQLDSWLLPPAVMLAASLLILAHIDQLLELRAAQLRSLAEIASARDAANRANRAKGLFLGRVSHDLRIPLQTLSGYLALARREQPGGAVGRYLGMIEKSGQAMLGLIGELLQFVRGEEGSLELRPRATYLHALIRQIASQGEILARANGNRFVLEVELDVPIATVDSERLHSVLMNLLSNACRMTVGGTVTLSVAGHATDGQARLRFAVRDTGPGVAAEDRERIFLPFEHGRSGTGSTGLGLAIVRQLVRLMGSDVVLDSQPGKGATFSFAITVPVADEADVLPPAALSAPFGYDGPVRTLLVVDDVAENRNFLQDLLTSMGFDVLLAAGVRDALAQARDVRVDAAIVDQYLQDGDGWQVLDALKAADPDRPVILLSGTPAQPPAARSSPWAFDACLLKPLELEAFTQVLGERLHLVWHAERATAPPSPAPAQSPVGPVTTADLAILRRAAHEGSLFEVEDWIERRRHLREEREFLNQLAPLVADARLPAIVSLVDRRIAA
jgi:signal transduction histidine kinase/CheY-like chemotaxis protein